MPKAKELLKNNDLSDFSKSELAAGIGTIEMKNGDVRRAKKLLRQAILDPTENALAQAQWVATELRMNIGTAVDVAQLENRVPASFEAQAIKSFYDCDFKKSLEASELWSRFQHMSSRPIVHASFVASTFLEDEPKAIEIMTTSMPAQQGDFTVTNNQAFSLVNLGEIKEGIRLLSTIDVQSLSKRERLVLSATSGFVSFRVGETDEARNLYNISIDGFNRLKDPMSAALATYFLAREEKRLQSEFAEARINEAKDRIKKLNLPPFNFLAKKL